MLRFFLCSLLLMGLASSVAAQTMTVNSSGTVRVLNGTTLSVGHDLTVSGALDANDGTVAFTGSESQTFTPATGQSIRNLLVNKTGGDLALKNNLFIINELRLTKGDLDLNGFTIDLGSTGTLHEVSGNTVKGTSGVITARRSLNAPTNDNVAGLGAEITSVANLGTTQIARGHTIQRSNGSEGIARYFDITPTNNSRLDATLVFHYDDTELNGSAELDLRLFRSTDGGASWDEEGGLPNATANTVTLGRIDAFSRWTLAGSGLLPVELVSFEAQADGLDVILSWQTASETNNAGFEVQVKDAEDWAVLGFIEGHGTTLEPQSYTYRAEALLAGRHTFRLKQIDYDGAFEFSPQVEVALELPTAFLLTPPYPNPFNPQAQFSLMVKRQQQVVVAVYDALGRQVRLLYDGTMGSEQAQAMVFEADDLPSGLYLIRAIGEAFVATQTVMLVR